MSTDDSPVLELRLVVTTEDFDQALRFYRDVLGLTELPSVPPPDGRVAILAAGRATLELAEPKTAEFIDEVEVGRRVAGHVRVAFEVKDAEGMTRRLEQAGAVVLGAARRTPFKSINARLDAPAGLQLTLFERDAP
jgi:predicted enzyme related to lactoylglutathione lyase